MRKLYAVLAIVVLTALTLAACAPAATPSPTEAPPPPAEPTAAPPTAAPAPTEAPPPEPFRVAVIMPSAINDAAFSQSMYDALLKIQSEMGAENFEIAYSENMFVIDDAAAAIRDYASQGYTLVIAHEFPETSFAHGTTVDTMTDKGINNVFAYEARSEEGGYVNGVVAAKLSQSGVIGVVGPIETGDAKLYVEGFTAGAQATNSDASVPAIWTGSFSDTALAAQAAQTHIDAGADILTGTAQMVTGAIGIAKESGVLWFGTQSNQTSLAPDIVVASQVYHWEVVLAQIIDSIKGGTLGGTAFAINLANGGEVIEYNSAYQVPQDVLDLAAQTAKGIADGSITVPLPAD